MIQEPIRSALERQGLTNVGDVRHNLPTSFLYEQIIRRGERWSGLCPRRRS